MANRNHVAPKTPHSVDMSIWAPTNARRIGEPRTMRNPCRISSRTGSRSERGGGGASGSPDREQQDGGDQVRDGVDRDRDRAGQELDEEAADPEAGELGDGPGRGQGAVGLDEPLALDDGRQVGVVGRVEERGQHCRQARHGDELP